MQEVIDVGMATIANCEKLIATGLQVLFDDFHGNRKDSGMWWHNDLDHIHEILGPDYSSEVLNSPDDLFQLLAGKLLHLAFVVSSNPSLNSVYPTYRP